MKSSRNIRASALVASSLALFSLLMGALPPAGATAVSSSDSQGSDTRRAVTARPSVEGDWQVGSGVMRIARTGEDTFTGVAITRIHVFGFPHCTVHDAGQPLFGPITARSNNDSTYYGPWSWWNVSGGGCERVSLDPDSLWAVSADGLSLEVCSETSSGRTSCTSLPRVPTDVVALGDSYSSGEGAGPDRDGGCHRSVEAWINTVVERSVGRFRLAKLLACSGAKVPDLSIPFKGQSAQVSQIPPETDLVTLTIGGNDTGFSEVLTNCVLQNCVNSGRLEEARRDVSRELPRLLAEAYASVRTRMPAGAELVVVGYPRLLPNSKEEEDCGWLRSQERRRHRRSRGPRALHHQQVVDLPGAPRRRTTAGTPHRARPARHRADRGESTARLLTSASPPSS